MRAPLPARLSAVDGLADPVGREDRDVCADPRGFGPLDWPGFGLPGVADGFCVGFGSGLVLVGTGVGVEVSVSEGVGVGVGDGLGSDVLVGVGSGLVLVGVGVGLVEDPPEEDGVGEGLAATGDAPDTAMTAATPAPVSTLPPIDRDRTAFTSVIPVRLVLEGDETRDE
ncbi:MULTISPECIES: hypothetical protein [Actinomadura]|uniref:Uncharacterized protein n=1 Tax=Actinomadura litoris TaxID=2678616 RepID=A0A7K1KXY1_9ACTN|nr:MULTISPECIES: hypothetical protein [Actinomadura]MBT2209124.1 hypothetical protein [Actinomadura sp. NEAU-AAG7]MUN37061.1 hypothetical protein [Actinomadura litoris]